MKIDNIDQTIIKMLKENARVTVKEIAKEVFLSSPSVCARINKLEKEGIIKGYTVLLNQENLGFFAHAFVQVDVKITQKEEFYQEISKLNQVLNCYNIAGDYSIMIEVMTENMHTLEKLIGRFQKYGNVKTNIIFSKL